MAILGYVVQYSNEDDYTIYHGGLKLYRNFSEALENAHELARAYLEVHGEQFTEPFEMRKPAKRDCDAAGSVVIFQSREYIVWIDCILD
jgi:hypothetical protein